MADFEDLTGELKETRSERMEQRTKPTVKRMIEAAAALVGADTSDFVVSAAYREAVRTIEESRSIRLSRDEMQRFLEALARPAQPSEAMRALMAHYEKAVENPIE
ncbi:MAG: DUF1778 domain-containing protein [Alphaproteobacteria bacterium]